MKRVAAAIALALGAAACGNTQPLGTANFGVFGGAPAPDDTAVVAVVNFSGGQCSGSLISPELVLTARHCVADTAEKDVQVVCGETTFNPPDSAGAIFVVPLPEISEDPKDYLAVSEVRMPPGVAEDLCGTDVVLLRLKKSLTRIPPLSPRLAPAVAPPEPYSAVGFGVDESLEGMPSGVRKRLDGLQVTCTGGACRDESVLAGEWVGSGGPCPGDSGGPALDADGHIIGVVSRGVSGCRAPVYSDVATRADWLRSEAIAAAQAAKVEPPAWACDAQHPCPTPDSPPKDDVPAESCQLAPAPVFGFSGLASGLCLLLARLRARGKNMSARRSRAL
jgi:hypothetical protein